MTDRRPSAADEPTHERALRPTAGARYEVDLLDHQGGSAHYAGKLHLPEGSHSLEVMIVDGVATARIEGPPDAKAHEKQAAALVKAAAKLPRAGTAEPPPSRIVRWRG